MEIYDKIFDWYVKTRNPIAGVDVVKNFIKLLKPEATILDLGCGNGYPITKMLQQLNFIDSSIKMIRQVKENFSDINVQCTDVVVSDFFKRNFDAVIAYGFMFHLPQYKQEKVIEKVSTHLYPDGYFLFSSGNEDTQDMTPPGLNGGARFMMYSLSSSNYEKSLNDNNMVLKNYYTEKNFGSTIYIAQKL